MKNVLLVDDDRVSILLCTRMLQRIGLVNDVDTALNGEQAIDLFNDYYTGTRTLPDIILLDLSMPVMDGFEFLDAFRRLNLPKKEKVKIIIVTSSDDPQDIIRAKAMGVRQYLTKPLNKDELIAALKSL